MYSSCLVCHDDLGRNDVVHSFAISKRIAFAPETGRLWAICEECGEWNLAPIEERWEAVEECEAIYQSTLERASGTGLSLGRVEGLELVRIGTETELPTLRYGARLRRRHRRQTLKRRLAGVAHWLSVGAAAIGGAYLAGFTGFTIGMFTALTLGAIVATRANPVVAMVPVGAGEWMEIGRRPLMDARLVPIDESGWSLRLRKGVEVQGADALEAIRLLLPLLNRSNQPKEQLRKALNYIDKKGGTLESVFAAAARRRGRDRTARIAKLEGHIRLALEILASRHVEARAVAEGLGPLQVAWDNAHELAAIQDELIYGPDILGRFRALKG